jgi:hypothetical protein
MLNDHTRRRQSDRQSHHSDLTVPWMQYGVILGPEDSSTPAEHRLPARNTAQSHTLCQGLMR